MLQYPDISPIALQLGPVAIRWYSLAYILGILGGWWLAGKMNKRAQFMNQLQFDAILSWVVVGIVLGGRLGYVIFYKPIYYLQNPHEILYLWEGGMSFHGGMIGTVISILIFCRVHKLQFFRVMDIAACVSPVGLLLGRLANFVNGELYGRVTDSPIGMVFPHSRDGLPRHASQLYEAAMEGALLFVIMAVFFWGLSRWKKPMFLSGMFLICYGAFRIIAECFREPDAHLGFLFEHMTMGQLLSIPMILLGLFLVIKANLNAIKAKNN